MCAGSIPAGGTTSSVAVAIFAQESGSSSRTSVPTPGEDRKSNEPSAYATRSARSLSSMWPSAARNSSSSGELYGHDEPVSID